MWDVYLSAGGGFAGECFGILKSRAVYTTLILRLNTPAGKCGGKSEKRTGGKVIEGNKLRSLNTPAGKCAGELQTQISVNGLSGGLYLLKLEMKGLRMRKKVMIFAE